VRLPHRQHAFAAARPPSCLIVARSVTRRGRYVVEFVDYSEKQTTDKEHVRVPKSEQVVCVCLACNMAMCLCCVTVAGAQEFIGVFEKKAGQKQESRQREERGDDRRDSYRGDRRDDHRDGRGGGRGRSPSPSRDQKSIEEQIREREREKALAVSLPIISSSYGCSCALIIWQVGKNYANKRPTSYKTALMTMTNTG
jgi:hypothetical protein